MVDWKKMISKPRTEVVLLFVTLFLFIITDRFLPVDSEWGALRLLFAGLVIIEMLCIVGMEVSQNTKKHGWKSEVVDTIVALLIALGIWFGAIFVLNTSSPVSGVVSCSMLPNLHRGDFVIVQGVEPEAYHISMSDKEFDSFSNDFSKIYHGEDEYEIEGSLYAFCLSHYDEICRDFRSNPSEFREMKGPLIYHYDMCVVNNQDGTDEDAPCVVSVEYDGLNYLTNFSHDIIVYEPSEEDVYRRVGDIVHRVFFIIDVNGKDYYITRGDNNPVLDMQVYDYYSMTGNYPVPDENYKGKVILRIPILGYFKLLISGFWQEDQQCKWQMDYPSVG